MAAARNNRADGIRATGVFVAALLQFAAGAIGGSGLAGESVGDVARSYPNPLLPSGGAFMIWNLIYLAILALAVWQLLPGQRGEAVHRRTGWWLVMAGALNTGWVALFSSGQIVASQVVIVALLVVLAMAWRRAASIPARKARSARLLLWAPLTLYVGWVTVATAVGSLTAVAAMNPEGVGPMVGTVTLLVVGVVSVVVVMRGVAVAGFVAATVWALAWTAVAADGGVGAVAAATALVVIIALVWRLLRAPDGVRVAFG